MYGRHKDSRNTATEILKRKPYSVLYMVLIVIFGICFQSCSHEDVVINSFILRDRIIVLNELELKKALYVAFTYAGAGSTIESSEFSVRGLLIRNGQIYSESAYGELQGVKGNAVFDLPAELSDGTYTIQIDIMDKKGCLAGRGTKKAARDDLKSIWEANQQAFFMPEEMPVLRRKNDAVPMSEHSRKAGYVLFARSLLSYSYPEETPYRSELINSISLHTARNKYLPVTFSIQPFQTLGSVQIEASELKSSKGIISKKKISIGYVDIVEDSIGPSPGTYRKLPAVIKPGNTVHVLKDHACQFWLTIDVDKSTAAGTYQGEITINPQYGKRITLPIILTVAPFTLEDIPGKDYFMLMTYEFAEMSMPWSSDQKRKIEKAGRAVFSDYRKHGMTAVCIHSPFIFTRKEDKSPRLDDIYAALLAARDEGFKKVIWYMGHLIQTSKPKHPGSIIGYEEMVQVDRLTEIVKTVLAFAKKNSCPEVIVMPIDEFDDESQDYNAMRKMITPTLLSTIKKAGGKSMLTGSGFNQIDAVDYFCSNTINVQDMGAFHKCGKPYWVYNNEVTAACNNPAFARYKYGYFVWKHNVDGMSSWTFQNTQNASGWPEKADGLGTDLYLAYPDSQGPLGTLKWEAIREGIDDYRYVYQLENRVARLKKWGSDTAEYEKFLQSLVDSEKIPSCNFDGYAAGRTYSFEERRKKIISLITEADMRLKTMQQRNK